MYFKETRAETFKTKRLTRMGATEMKTFTTIKVATLYYETTYKTIAVREALRTEDVMR